MDRDNDDIVGLLNARDMVGDIHHRPFDELC
jgi:hypothetical protein